MEYNTLQPWQEIDANGVIYDITSLYAYFERVATRARRVASVII